MPTVKFGTLKVPLSLHRSGDDGWTRLVRSFATLAVGEGAARFFGLIAALVLARRLGPSGLGLAALGISLVSWFRFLVDSGTEALKTRQISETPERFRELADRVLGLRIVSATVATALYVIVVLSLSRSSYDRMVLLLFALVLPAMALNLRWMVLGIRAQRAVAIANACARLVFVVGIVLFVYPHGGVLRVPFLEAISELTYGLVIIYLISHAVGIVRPRVDVAAWARTLRQSLPLMVVGVTQATLLFADILLIGGLKGPRFAGYYGAAVRPALFVSSVLSLFAVSFLAAYSAADSERAPALVRRAIRTLAAVSLPTALALSLAAPVVIPLLFGHRFSPAITALTILAWTIPLAALSSPYAGVLVARDRMTTLMWNNVAAATFAVVGYGIAIPIFGIKGAATVRVAAAALSLVLNYRAAVAPQLAPRFHESFTVRPLRLGWVNGRRSG